MSYVVVASLVGALVLAAGAGIKGYLIGRESRESEVIELRSAIAASEKLVAAERTRLDAVAKKAAAQFQAKLKQIQLEAENRPQLIKVIRDEASCDLPPAFRMLHDAAAGYSAAEGSGGAVEPAVAAETIAVNYQLCRENAARQQELINLVTESQNGEEKGWR